jgi:MFS family permease
MPHRLRDSFQAFEAVFRSRSLRRLQLALAGSVIGDWAFGIALSVYAYRAGGASALGLLVLARWVSAGLLAPFLSVVADRYRRRAVMVTADVTRLVAVTVAALAVWADASSLIVYAMAIFTSVASTVFQPAQTALLPSLTATPEELTAANVVTGTIEGVGTFAGPALGGLLLIWFGIDWVMAFDAATFVWSLALLLQLPRGEPAAETTDGWGSEALGGLRAVARDRRLALIIGLFGAQTLVDGALGVLIVVMAFDLLHAGASGVGTFNAAVGIGSVLGSLVAAALVGRGKLAGDFAIGLIAWGVPIIMIAAFTDTRFALIMLGVLGIGNVLVDVSGFTLLQRVAPDEVLGRVLGVLESVFAMTVGAGAALAPLLINEFGTRGALVATGTLLPALALVCWPMLARIDRGAALPERLALARTVPFLAPLPEATLERITAMLEPVDSPAESLVFRQGEAGDRFYLIESGEVAVIRDGDEVARLGVGGYFGEIALVDDVPHTADVRAESDCRLLALDRDEFIAAVTGHAPSAAAANAVVSARMTGLRAGHGRV